MGRGGKDKSRIMKCEWKRCFSSPRIYCTHHGHISNLYSLPFRSRGKSNPSRRDHHQVSASERNHIGESTVLQLSDPYRILFCQNLLSLTWDLYRPTYSYTKLLVALLRRIVILAWLETFAKKHVTDRSLTSTRQPTQTIEVSKTCTTVLRTSVLSSWVLAIRMCRARNVLVLTTCLSTATVSMHLWPSSTVRCVAAQRKQGVSTVRKRLVQEM